MKKIELTPEEIKKIHDSLRGSKPQKAQHDHTFHGRHTKFGYYSDPHVGEVHFHEVLWRAMVKKFTAEGIEVVYCPGDNLEGMSGRPGHIYSLTHIGASAQIGYATKLFHLAPKLHFFIIDGN